MTKEEHFKFNKTNGEYCSYYCQTSGTTCLSDSDCSGLGSNYCCSVLQRKFDLHVVGSSCVRKDLSEVWYNGWLYYASCFNSTTYSENLCSAALDCQNNYA
mmetsp:Transcript_41222/g.39706  ORF Transcript_41222/g.39706 Transcript_41222/m.39706 type:complete len:101 (+) Transcript_41222:212-514(+)